jgi:hypothetical protein
MAPPTIIFKVTLMGRESIWRKIAMKESHTLDDFHYIIFDAFDREEEHLYSFYFPPKGKKFNLRNIRKAQEFAHPAACDDAGPFGPATANAGETKLGSLGLKPKQTFYYLFDYGDEWWHEITVEGAEFTFQKGQRFPCIVDRKGKSPSQYPDCDDEYDDEEVDSEDEE